MEPGAEARKPLRARKTMALSSRAQARALGRGAAGDCAGGRPDAPKAPPGPGARPFLSAGALQDVLRRWYEREPARASPGPPPPEQQQEEEEAAPDAAGPPGDAERKRAASRGDEDVLSKRIRAAGGPAEGGPAGLHTGPPGLGKVKCFIQNRLEISMGELHHGLQRLNERIARTQCLRKHEGIAIKIVKKISRLDRRINAVISFQNTKLSRKVRLIRHQCSSADKNHRSGQPPEAQSKLSNGATLLPSMADSKPAPPKKPTATETLSPTTGRSSDADDFPHVEAPKKSSGCFQQQLQNVSLIDSIDEGSNTNKEGKKKVAEKRPSAHESLLANLLQPARQSPNQVPSRFPHLPPLPSVESNPEHAKDFRDTLPPQKLKLAVAQVHQPKGIALQWDVSRADPRCAPIESFSLFICLEDADSGATGDWRTNIIKALPLPMACSLSHFPRSAKCYITMQSKDIHGRYGPFCEIQSISAL